MNCFQCGDSCGCQCNCQMPDCNEINCCCCLITSPLSHSDTDHINPNQSTRFEQSSAANPNPIPSTYPNYGPRSPYSTQATFNPAPSGTDRNRSVFTPRDASQSLTRQPTLTLDGAAWSAVLPGNEVDWLVAIFKHANDAGHIYIITVRGHCLSNTHFVTFWVVHVCYALFVSWIYVILLSLFVCWWIVDLSILCSSLCSCVSGLLMYLFFLALCCFVSLFLSFLWQFIFHLHVTLHFCTLAFCQLLLSN